jgi:hypothetical protein
MPSLKTALGITRAKRRTKSALGVYNITRITNAPSNAERRLKRRVGYYSTPMKLIRLFGRLFK